MICTELDQPHIMSVAILLASYSLDLRLVRDGGWNYAESFAAGLFWLASNFSAKSRHAFAICNRRALSAGCKHFEASAMHCPTYA
ncbi:hypothetical protein SAMN05444169_6646 [Bradyrhizobium erythrophlei]|jgi:hypothetical protein|uniref:Uncharacterized protein n=1 Tax=Bradyrhizobium erythrophlei TaxID=1437360 RepID=A0A1M5RMA6_9BRAD|nr:hypothetical protein SAMN05444169_6646 [Bradyrhizobium erythrophlei]